MGVWPSKSHVCLWCGGSLEGRARQARYCSDRCRWDKAHKKQTETRQLEAKAQGRYLIGEVMPCVVCGCDFVKSSGGRVTCSIVCASELCGVELWRRQLPPHKPVHFLNCVDCDRLCCFKSRKPGLCQDCSKARRRQRYRRKNVKRRGASGDLLSVRELADRDGVDCYLCGVGIDLNLSGLDADGPTIDHVIPLKHGGTNNADNLRLTHRRCNTLKGSKIVTSFPAKG